MNKQELIKEIHKIVGEHCFDRVQVQDGWFNWLWLEKQINELDEPSREDDEIYIKSLEEENFQKLSSLKSCYQCIEELEKALDLAEDEALKPTRNIETDNFKDYCILQAQYELKRFKEKSDE